MKKYISIIFFVVLFLNIWAGHTQNIHLVWLTKPLLMPLLFLQYYLFSKNSQPDKWLLFALFFSWLGDIFLMITASDLFIPGLLSFMIAHICYIFLFKKQLNFNTLLALPIVVYSVIYFIFLQNKIVANLKIPVLVYCVILTLMGIMAIERHRRLNNYAIVLMGALFFMISDSFLAYNKFVSPLPYSNLLIMGTYGLAQYLITQGWIKSENG